MTQDEIKSAIKKETKTTKALVAYLFERDNAPADYFQLMTLASDEAIAKSTNRLFDMGILELVPMAGKALMQVRLNL